MGGVINLQQSGPSYTSQDTFTGTGTGNIINATSNPCTQHSIQVVSTNAAATVWTVVLEGSLDGENFTPILTHNTAIGDKVVVFIATSPCLYVRSNTTSLTLGLATNIVVTILSV